MSSGAPLRDRLFADEEARYVTNSPSEIVSVLRTALRKGALVTAYFNHGNDFALTSILAVDPEEGEVIYDAPAQPETRTKLAAAQRVTFVTSEDGIKIKFSVTEIKPRKYDGQPAFVSAIPGMLLRMQRREYYRVACPIGSPLKCRVKIMSGERLQTAEVTVMDLSCGGVSVIDSHPDLNFEQDAVISGCEIELPDVGTIQADLQVRNSFEVSLKNGTVCKRSGCRFVNPSQSTINLIQRYIMKLERERNPRFGGR